MPKRHLTLVCFMLLWGVMGQAWAGSISGTVRNSGTLQPLEQIVMYLYAPGGIQLENTVTESNGIYSFTCSQGSYAVEAASQSNGYIGSYAPVTLDTEIDSKTIDFNLVYGGSFSGTIKDTSTGSGISNVTVYAFENGVWAGTAVSDDNGSYRLGGLPAGKYKVETYSSEYLTVLAKVTVKLGVDTPNINFTLGRGGAIEGTLIYDPNSIYTQIQVEAHDVITGAYVKGTASNATGYFKIKGLPCNKCYRVEANTFSTDYIGAYYPDQICVGNCNTVNAGNLPLKRGGGFKGKVVDKNTGNPVPGIIMNAYTCITTAYAKSAHTNSQGNFEISGLVSGRGYYIEANTYGTQYIGYYTGCNIVSQIGETSTLETVRLTSGGYIAGVVKNTFGIGIKHLNVQVRDTDDRYVADAFTQTNGAFRVGGLPPATYIVRTNAIGIDIDYVDEYYDNVNVHLPGRAENISLTNATPSYTLPNDIILDTDITTIVGSGKMGNIYVTNNPIINSTNSADYLMIVINTPVTTFQVKYSSVFSVSNSDLPSNARARAYTFQLSGGDIFIFSLSDGVIPSEIWLPYDPNKVPSGYESEITLKHYQDGEWVDVTIISVDTINHGILVDLDSFSPFAIIYPVISAASSTGGSGGGGGGKCFIATAAFGTPFAREVQTLRNFRDAYLLTNDLGQEFVSLYYKFSPPVADLIRGHEFLRATVRTMLRPVIWLVQTFCPQCKVGAGSPRPGYAKEHPFPNRGRGNPSPTSTLLSNQFNQRVYDRRQQKKCGQNSQIGEARLQQG